LTLHQSLPRPHYLGRFIATLVENAPWDEISRFHVSLPIPTSRRAVQIPFSAYQRVGRGAIIVLLEYEVRHAGG